MKGLIAVPVRLFAFLGKELVETVRRPGALFSLVLGPFLIMAIFGLGYDGYRNPLRTVVVAPPETGLPQNPSDYADIAGDALVVTEVTADRHRPRSSWRTSRSRCWSIAPGDAEERFRNGEQSVIAVEVNVVDPVQAAYARSSCSCWPPRSIARSSNGSPRRARATRSRLEARSSRRSRRRSSPRRPGPS